MLNPTNAEIKGHKETKGYDEVSRLGKQFVPIKKLIGYKLMISLPKGALKSYLLRPRAIYLVF